MRLAEEESDKRKEQIRSERKGRPEEGRRVEMAERKQKEQAPERRLALEKEEGKNHGVQERTVSGELKRRKTCGCEME